MTERLTIAIPSYKNVESLERAIQSVLSLRDVGIEWDLLVSVDYSENQNKIVELSKKYVNSKVRFIYNKPALGKAMNWNHCIEESNTEYVSLLHDDDYLLDDYLFYVRKILESKYVWDCVVFSHYFEIDGKRQEKNESGVKKIYENIKEGKIRKLRSLDYLLGGYNYEAIPTCGILFKKKAFLEFGGYRAEDGYSADEIFMERFLRAKHKVLFYNVYAGVYTYTTNTNLSSQRVVQLAFIEENKKHRKEMAKENMWYRCLINRMDISMTLLQAGQWRTYLMPEFVMTKHICFKMKIFSVICRIYQYMKLLTYRRI